MAARSCALLTPTKPRYAARTMRLSLALCPRLPRVRLASAVARARPVERPRTASAVAGSRSIPMSDGREEQQMRSREPCGTHFPGLAGWSLGGPRSPSACSLLPSLQRQTDQRRLRAGASRPDQVIALHLSATLRRDRRAFRSTAERHFYQKSSRPGHNREAFATTGRTRTTTTFARSRKAARYLLGGNASHDRLSARQRNGEVIIDCDKRACRCANVTHGSSYRRRPLRRGSHDRILQSQRPVTAASRRRP